MAKTSEIVCTSYFKSSDVNEIKKVYNELWIQIINQKEKTRDTQGLQLGTNILSAFIS